MLLKELKVEESLTTNVTPTSLALSKNILDWKEEQVQECLIKHNLIKMSRLLTNCDGRSLIYLRKYMKSCQPQQILNLLQEDSVALTNHSVSLIELSRFQSLMDQQKQLM
jgi:hypothetical protein